MYIWLILTKTNSLLLFYWMTLFIIFCCKHMQTIIWSMGSILIQSCAHHISKSLSWSFKMILSGTIDGHLALSASLPNFNPTLMNCLRILRVRQSGFPANRKQTLSGPWGHPSGRHRLDLANRRQQEGSTCV